MLTVSEERPVSVIRTIDCVLELTRAYVAGVDMGDGGSVDSGRPETPDTDESSEVSIIFIYLFFWPHLQEHVLLVGFVITVM